MHEVQVKGILSPKGGMNLYRGCSHGCIYCDSRSSCYRMAHPFEDIEIKSNAIPLLEEALRKRRSPCMIGTGAMTDPYIPVEEKLEHTRQALLLIEKYGCGATLITKSDLILRDLDILQRINQKTKCVVQMTLTTWDENLCSILEPNVAGTARRAEVLNILRDSGIPTVVWLCPILPWINDTRENIEGILQYCVEAQVYGILCFGMGLTLRQGNREYFYQKLDQHFPGLKQRYIKTYGDAYEITSPRAGELMELLNRTCERYGMERDREKIFQYLGAYERRNEPRQLSMWD